MPMHQAFDVEQLTRHFALDNVPAAASQAPSGPKTEACLDDRMTASRAFFHREQAGHAAKTLALQAQVDRMTARRASSKAWEPLRSRRHAEQPPVIEVEVCGVRPQGFDDARGGL